MKRRDAEYRPSRTPLAGWFLPRGLIPQRPFDPIFNSSPCLTHLQGLRSILQLRFDLPLYPASPSGCRDRDRVERGAPHDASPSKTEFQRSADDVPLASWTSVRKEMSS